MGEAESPTIHQGAFLHVLVVDHEKVGSDDFLCGTTMSLWDLCRGGSQIHEIDRPLTQEGKFAGRIKFKLDVAFPEVGRRGTRTSMNFARFFHWPANSEETAQPNHNHNHIDFARFIPWASETEETTQSKQKETEE